MVKTIKYSFLIVLIVCTAAFIYVQYKTIWYDGCIATRIYYPVVLPALVIYLFFLSKRMLFVENFLHEITHILFAVLTFQKVNSLYVTSTSGAVYTESARKSTLVSLSPYFFPLITMMFICLFTLVDFQYSRHIVMVSYVLFLVVLLKNLIKASDEITSSGIKGWLLLTVLNFWMDYFILSWCLSNEFDLYEILILINNGIKGVLQQFKIV